MYRYHIAQYLLFLVVAYNQVGLKLILLLFTYVTADYVGIGVQTQSTLRLVRLEACEDKLRLTRITGASRLQKSLWPNVGIYF